MLAVVPEVLSHGAAGVGGQVLQGGGVGGGGGHHNGVLHGVSVGEPLDQLGHGGPLLADGHIDAVQLLLLVCAIVETLLVDDGVDGNGGFSVKLSRLAISESTQVHSNQVKIINKMFNHGALETRKC